LIEFRVTILTGNHIPREKNHAYSIIFTLGELADHLGVQSWRIARLFVLGLVPEPERKSGRRMIPKSAVPAIVTALKSKGWYPTTSTTKGESNDT
jgi:hypothetical protein